VKDRSYHQYCGLAYALDIVGERWTLLIVRELFAGPRRFKDLLAGLPHISTNLLVERLKSLEHHGMLQRRVLPPPAGSTVYELTPLALALEPMLLELGRWGSQFVPSSPAGASVLPVGSYALTLKTFFRPEQAQGIDETYVLHIGDDVLQVRVHDRTIQVQQGEPPRAAMVLHADAESYLGLLAGHIQPDDALAQGMIRVDGDPAALQRFLRICGLPQTQSRDDVLA
jgi:DNA-binding HxlR family transcriptional regulator